MFVDSPRRPATDQHELPDARILPSAEPESGFKPPTAFSAAPSLSLTGWHVGRSSQQGLTGREAATDAYSHDARAGDGYCVNMRALSSLEQQ